MDKHRTNLLDDIIRRALDEDIGDGDITTQCTIPPDMWLSATIRAKADGVVAGQAVAARTFTLLDERVRYTPHVPDGAAITRGTDVATIEGPGHALLLGERTALNFMQRMSGIATLTRRFVDAVAHTRTVILDTRKTAPGLRLIDKWAVRLGGGQNHRMGLYDMVLIKENHIAAAGSITAAVQRVRAGDPRHRPIEVETRTLDDVREALALNVDRILLDNMPLDAIRAAVEMVAGRIPLEASGNVSLETVAQIAETGVDFISVGALTHSAPAFDLSMLVHMPTNIRQQERTL